MDLKVENSSTIHKRDVFVEISNNKLTVGFGFPMMWYLHDMLIFPPEDNKLYVDACGRNFGETNTVYCDYDVFLREIETRLVEMI